jgi:stage V sporulation protein SpoVS
MTKSIKISRSAIKQAIKETPIEQILLGSQNPDGVRLTKKQKDFARKVAEGKPKAQAYRESYDSNGKPTTEAVEGSKLASNPKIAQMISAFTMANQAREYLIPAQIRTMAIQNLVGIAIDEEEKTSNKLKALELIGKMSEVALFTERKELIHTNNSADIKEKLIEGLRLAFSNARGVNDLAKRKAESLLVELSDPNPPIDAEEVMIEPATPSAIGESSDPPDPDPQISTNFGVETLHSNPLKESPADSLLADLTITPVIVTNPLESDTCASIGVYPNALEAQNKGVGSTNSGQSAPDVSHETPPVNNSNEKA